MSDTGTCIQQRRKLLEMIDQLIKQADQLRRVPNVSTISGRLDAPHEERKVEDDPLLTDYQKYMSASFELGGFIGLAECIRDIALTRMREETEEKNRDDIAKGKRRASTITPVGDTSRGHSSWKTLADDIDQDHRSRALFYLATLAPEATKAFIRGVMPQMMQDDDFKHSIGRWYFCKDTQGVYSVYVAIQDPTRSSQIPYDLASMVGRGLTLSEMKQVLEHMRKYIDVDDPDSAELAEEIDDQKQSGKQDLDYETQRRYGSGEECNKFTEHKKWLDILDNDLLRFYRAVVGTQDADLLKIPLHRCFCYVGLSHNCEKRPAGHMTHAGKSSPFFGLFTATVRYLFGEKFHVRDSTFQVFKTVDVDDIGLDEIVASVLLSAYPKELGLSYTYAGGSKGTGPHRDSNAYLDGLERNAKSIARSGFMEENFHDARTKIERAERIIEFLDNGDSRQFRIEHRAKILVEELSAVCDAANADMEEVSDTDTDPLDEELRKAEEECEGLRKAFEILESED